MIRAAARNAGKPGKTRIEEEAVISGMPVRSGRCFRLYVPPAVVKPRFHSSRAATGRFTVKTATGHQDTKSC